MTAGVVLVPGTWAWSHHDGTRPRWYKAGSPFVQFLEDHEIEVLSKARPFVWSTDLNGAWIGGGRKQHSDWAAGGQSLSWYLDPAFPQVGLSLLPEQRQIICHSHGLQVALYAAASGCEIQTLVSVCSPIRRDMMDVAIAARPRIRCWIHLYSDWSDLTMLWGEVFDGVFKIERHAHWYDDHGEMRVWADESLGIPGVGHSGLITEPDRFHLWASHGVLQTLRRPFTGRHARV